MTEGVLIVGVEGLSLSQKDKDFLRHPLVAGVILFDRNFSDKAQLAELVESIHDLKPGLVVCIDQESQRVQRLKKDFSLLPDARKIGYYYNIGARPAIAVAYAFGLVIGVELRSVGIDISFAPVLDLARSKGIIEGRAFHHDPKVVTELGRSMIKGLHDAGLPAIGKHFPGHGSVSGDTHTDIIYDPRAFSEIEENDLQPYRVLIEEQQLDGIMNAHVIYSAVSEQVASLSQRWLSVIRDDLNFNGFVCSDDLDMSGCRYADSSVLKRALSAGCDALLICHSGSEKRKIIGDFSDSEISYYNQLSAKHWDVIRSTKENTSFHPTTYLGAVEVLESFNNKAHLFTKEAT